MVGQELREALMRVTKAALVHEPVSTPVDPPTYLWVDALAEMPEVEALVEAVRSDPVARGQYRVDDFVPDNLTNGLILNLLVPWLDAYIREREDRQFDEAVVDSLLERLDAFFEAPEVGVLLTAPLSGFTGDSDIYEVGKGIRIVRAAADSETEKRITRLQQAFSGTVDSFEQMTSTFAVELEFALPKHGAIDHRPDGTDRMEHLVAALRLLRPGFVRTTTYEIRVRPPAFAFLTGAGSRLLMAKVRGRARVGHPYEMSAMDAAELPGLFKRVEKAMKTDAHFGFALRRFDAAYDRMGNDDRLIDFWIALESLFAHDSQGEVALRASLRAARFVGESATERVDIKKALKDSYVTRSKIVHGDPKQPSPTRLTNDADFTEEVLRKALRKWPSAPHGLSDIDAEMLQ